MNPNYLTVFQNQPGVNAFFSTKSGASPKSPYNNEEVLAELNPQHFPLVWPTQVHKDYIHVVKKEMLTVDSNLVIPECDGVVTNVPEIFLTTVHADCLAVFFYDPIKKSIGLVHAGWRGTVLGIAPKAVKIMIQEYGSKPEDILCFISPGISKCCFETGPEVLETFLETWPWACEFSTKAGEKNYLDLKGINQRQLQLLGVQNIQISEVCTCCQWDLFCSYRKENSTTKRMGGGICLNK